MLRRHRDGPRPRRRAPASGEVAADEARVAAARRPPPALALQRRERADPPQPRSPRRGAGDAAAAPACRGGGDGRLAQRRPRRRDPARQHRARRLPALAGTDRARSPSPRRSPVARGARLPSRTRPGSGARSAIDEDVGTIIRPPGVRDRQRRHRQGAARRPRRRRPAGAPDLRGRLLRRHPHRRLRRPGAHGAGRRPVRR